MATTTTRAWHHDHRPVADDGLGRPSYPQTNIQYGSHRGPPATDRRGEAPRSTPSSSCWASRRWKRPAADRVVAAGGDLPPFHEVPFTISIDLAGTPTTLGLRALDGAYPSVDAPVVERMKLPGLSRSVAPTASRSPFGGTPTVSSGGDHQSLGPLSNTGCLERARRRPLATWYAPLGLGNDGLSSLRWPAQCCGVSALKPTLGRIPQCGSIEPMGAAIGMQLTTVVGPLARRIADLRAAEVLAGPTWRDPWTVPRRSVARNCPSPFAWRSWWTQRGSGSRNRYEGVLKATEALEARDT